MNEEVTMKFIRFIQNWGGSALIECETEDSMPTRMIGPVRPDEVQTGIWYRWWGKWQDHPDYGMQFRFKTFIEAAPLDPEGMVAYLTRAPGMTKARARRVVLKYEANAVKMLRDLPATVVEEINMPAFTDEKAEEASEYLKNQQKTEAATIELISLFAGRGFRADLPKRLIQKFGNTAAQHVKDNPYLLLDFKGVGFPLADGLYLELGKNPKAIERQGLCIWYGLKEVKGHTWCTIKEARGHLDRQIGGADVRLKAALLWCLEGNWIQRRRKEDGSLWLAEYYRAASEETIAVEVARMLEYVPDWPDITEEEGLSGHQALQINAALHARIGIFGGGPGTGKTYTAARLISRILKAEPYEQVALAAPTGKAANRLTEVVNGYDVRLHATTIHRLLGVSFEDETTYQFVHGPDDPLPHKYVIVDESSMLDTDLFASLIAALSNKAHLLLIGDIDQLPPVGHGAPLRDLIQSSKVPYGYLTETIRNTGEIVETCKKIRNNERLILPAKFDMPNGGNLMIYRHSDEGSTISCMLSILSSIERNKKSDPMWDIQILVPTNKSTALSRIPVNAILQKKLNKENESDSRFWVDDKVVCEKNSWFPAVDEFQQLTEDVISQTDQDGRLQIFVANGELGKVVRDEARRTLVEFLSPKRFVVVPRSEGKDALTLGYALSGHKSQGSEWPIIIILLDPSSSASGVCDRSWIYTVISRAKRACILIGTDRTFNAMRGRNNLNKRQTLLVDQIMEQIHVREASRHPQDSVPKGGTAASENV